MKRNTPSGDAVTDVSARSSRVARDDGATAQARRVRGAVRRAMYLGVLRQRYAGRESSQTAG